jgi:RNA polymerase sigma-70 factor (ECF subfamily)
LSENDFDWMRRLRAGDESAVAELYDRYTPLLYSYLVRILGDREGADGSLEETWIEARRSAATYESSRGPLAAWLLSIARARAFDWARVGAGASRRRGESGAEGEAPANVLDDPLAAAEHRQLAERVRRAMVALEPKHRRVLECACFDGLSQADTATRLGAPVGTVKSWTRQALTRLRELLPSEEWA